MSLATGEAVVARPARSLLGAFESVTARPDMFADDDHRVRTLNEWYIQQEADGDEVGPLRPSELLRAVRLGKVRESTRVRKGDSAWFAASEVNGLFEAAAKPDIEFCCPYCKRVVTKPPVTCGHCGMHLYHANERIKNEGMQTPAGRGDGKNGSVAKRSMASWLKRKKLGG